MDTSQASEEVWIIKVPNYVAQAWTNAPSLSVGKLVMEDVPEQAPKLSLELTGVKGHVSCKMDARVRATYRDKEGRLVVDESFARIAREKAEEEKRKVQANTIQVIKGRITRPLPRNIPHKRKNDDEDGTKLKRSRLEKDELEKELFRLFEKEKYWHLATLQANLNQPSAWLKEVLNEIAVLNRSGPNLGQYELKREYKTSTN